MFIHASAGEYILYRLILTDSKAGLFTRHFRKPAGISYPCLRDGADNSIHLPLIFQSQLLLCVLGLLHQRSYLLHRQKVLII